MKNVTFATVPLGILIQIDYFVSMNLAVSIHKTLHPTVTPPGYWFI